MKRRLGLLLGVTVFGLLLIFNPNLTVGHAAPSAAPEKEKDKENAADDNGTALTIYNQKFSVAREHVPLDLKAGVNQAEYAGIAAHLEPDSVILRDPNGRTLQILEQNYRNDPVSQEMLLSFYEGKTIDFTVGRNADGSEVRVPGKVVRSGYVPTTYINGYPQQAPTQPIIDINGILRFGLPGEPRFPALSTDS